MDFSLAEEQEMLRSSARDFLATECPKDLVREMAKDETGFPQKLWKQMTGVGWLGLLIPEEYGGSEGSFLDLVVLMEQTGQACLPGPFFSTVVLGGLSILEAGSEQQKQELLPRLAQGNLLLTLAITEAEGEYTAEGIQAKAIEKDGSFSIQGTKLFVPDAHISDYVICAARTKQSERPEDGITLFLVDSKASGVHFTLLKTIAGDKQCEVVFDDVKVQGRHILGELNKGWPIVEKVLEKATIARCAEMLGGARNVLKMTVDYAKERKQFDRPIGSFQAIQHYCANMVTEVDGCFLITYEAAWKLSQGLPASREVSMAKAYISDKFRQIVTLAHQIHGAIGFTEDHDLPLYFKRAKAWEYSLGDGLFHLNKVAKLAGI